MIVESVRRKKMSGELTKEIEQTRHDQLETAASSHEARAAELIRLHPKSKLAAAGASSLLRLAKAIRDVERNPAPPFQETPHAATPNVVGASKQEPATVTAYNVSHQVESAPDAKAAPPPPPPDSDCLARNDYLSMPDSTGQWSRRMLVFEFTRPPIDDMDP